MKKLLLTISLFVFSQSGFAEAMYLDCSTKGPKIGGDHAQETIDIAVPFFVNALQ